MSGFWSRIGAALAWLGGTTLTAPGQPATAPETSLIGAKLADVQANCNLFSFFQFEPIGEPKPSNGMQVTSYKPNGPSFRQLVTLHIQTDSANTIRAMNLEIAQSFISSPQNGVYAADLAKSYLYDIAASGDIGALAAEINTRSMQRSGATILTAQPLPTMPGPPTAAYQTYAGDSRPAIVTSASGKFQVVLRNLTRDGTGILELTATAKN